jgi:hypothetical protein
MFTVTGADAQAWKDDANLAGGHISECPICGCHYRTEDDGVPVGSGGGIQLKDEARPRITSTTGTTSGPAIGGTTVRINGHALDRAATLTVKFDGIAGTGLSVVDDTAVDINTPAGRIKLVLADGPYQKMDHGTVTGGPFQVGETLTGGTSAATCEVVEVDGGGAYVLVKNVSGTFQASETLSGGTSSATASFTSLADLPFSVGETVTGVTSTETGTVDTVSPLRITSPSGSFTAGEDITGGTSGARATLDGTTPMDGNVNVSVENTWGQRLVDYEVVNGFDYTA